MFNVFYFLLLASTYLLFSSKPSGGTFTKKNKNI